MKTTVGKTLIFLMVFFFIGEIHATTVIMPINQIKAGMKGKGKSVFVQDKVEEFDVEILGVLANVLPKKDIILARLTGKGLENTGVISGMSGSPVYLEGKLIGAIAYSFPFAKEAIAGITPIGEMLSLSLQKEGAKPSFSSQIPFSACLTFEDLLEMNKDLFSPKQTLVSDGQTFFALGLPLYFSGFSSKVFYKAKPFFTSLGLFPVTSGASGQVFDSLSPSPLTLREGDPVGVQLIGGDLNVSAVGTVTHVDGNRILAFGHPLYNLGTVDYAMTKAKVLTIVPSLENSFKLATTEALVGKFSQDRSPGALGELGKMPQLIPLNVRMNGPGSGHIEYKLKIVNDRILSPFFVNLTLASILTSEERSYGNLSLEMEGDVYLDNGLSVHLEDLYSGNFDNSVTSLSGLLTAVVYFLANNEFKELGIHRMDITINASEEVRLSSLERIWMDKYEALPGERIQIKIFSRTFRGESFRQEVEIVTPHLPSGSEFHLIIGDAGSMHQIEMNQYRTRDFVPRNLPQLIRILNNLRKNNRIYFKIVASKPGLFLRGEEMPNLPPTMKSMFSSPRAAASSPTELTKSTLNEYQLPVPYVFRGMAVVPVKIK